MVKSKKRRASSSIFPFLSFLDRFYNAQQNNNRSNNTAIIKKSTSAGSIYEHERQQRMMIPDEQQCIHYYHEITILMDRLSVQLDKETADNYDDIHNNKNDNDILKTSNQGQRRQLSVVKKYAQHILVSPRGSWRQPKQQRQQMKESTLQYDGLSSSIIKRLYQILPPEILYLILVYLDPKDIVELTGISQGWFHYMVQWPEFWELASSVIPRLNQSKLNTLLYHNINEDDPVVVSEIHLGGPIKIHFLDNVLKCLIDSHHPSLTKLSKY
ncbi:hypothetical protein BDA99DRAFT_527669 [Phascolomyces articulosus]|uniref:F-box domain-containing protein n=1 Tax=Phascolomyces articulosus TaxID=60185 RepID=A0AAD5P7P1_9FUNG|nr:hypothetical protein BDA99DRAFT_527669 [Phascolomyces articulosus]